MQKIYLFLYFVSFFLNAQIAEGAIQKLLVFDGKENKQGQGYHDDLRPHAFRSTANASPFFCGIGLSKLRTSASSQFTANQIARIIHEVTQRENIQPADIIIIDLRQESHFFVNGRPFTIFTPYLAGYAGQTVEEISSQELESKKYLDKATQLTIHTVSHKSPRDRISESEPNDVPVDKLMTEEMLAAQMGVRYVRFSVQDECRPDDATVDRFLELIKTLPAHSWMHFHCRGGQGRTTTFFLMNDILKNHSILSLQNLMDRHAAMGGKNLSNTNEKDSFVKQEAEKRLRFIHHFYAYATANDGYGHQTWQEWVAKHPLDEPKSQVL